MQYYLKKHHKNFGETEQSCSQVHLEKQTYKKSQKKKKILCKMVCLKGGQRTEREECDDKGNQKFKTLKLQLLSLVLQKKTDWRIKDNCWMDPQKRSFGLGQGFSTSVLLITSFDNQKSLQTLSNVSWRTKLSLVENHRFMIMVVFQTGGWENRYQC